MDKEIWKDINGFEGWYQVSNRGRVRSVDRTITQMSRYGHNVNRKIKGRTVTPTDNGNGYKIVGLTKNQDKANHYVHRLVAETFINNPNRLPEVNHKDSDKSNNDVNNLEWVTRIENIKHAQPRMKRPHVSWKDPASGYKYIQHRNGRYRLNIPNRVDRTYKTLAEALAMREVVMSGDKYFAV